MTSSLSNLVKNLAEGLYRIKCKYGYNNKNVKHTELRIKCSVSACFFKAIIFPISFSNAKWI